MILLAAAGPAPAAETDFPAWLSGEPDLAWREEHCRLYDRILADADRQTDGAAGESAFARKRLINLANKLADHHRASPADDYSAELPYLIIGTVEPAHHELRMDRAELEALLQGGPCD